jgi:hypothetical protein
MPVPRTRVASPLKPSGQTAGLRKARLARAEIDDFVDASGDGSAANRAWKFKWTQRRETWDFVHKLFGIYG